MIDRRAILSIEKASHFFEKYILDIIFRIHLSNTIFENTPAHETASTCFIDNSVENNVEFLKLS